MLEPNLVLLLDTQEQQYYLWSPAYPDFIGKTAQTHQDINSIRPPKVLAMDL